MHVTFTVVWDHALTALIFNLEHTDILLFDLVVCSKSHAQKISVQISIAYSNPKANVDP